MKRLLEILTLSALCLFSSLSPVAALTQDEAYKIARWAGLGDEVRFHYITDGNVDGINGYFVAGGVYCYFLWACEEVPTTVALIAGRNVPDDIAVYVLLHEVGHYLQWREKGTAMFQLDPIELEWEADVIALNLMCARHLDGRSIIQRMFDWVYLKFDYTGDVTHGSAAERVAHAIKYADRCDRRVEAA